MNPKNGLDLVFNYYRSGRVDAGDATCRALLQESAPLETPLLLALGMIAQQAGSRLAIDLFGMVLAATPDHIDAHFYLGNALLQDGRLADAEASYARALAVAADHADAIYQLGVIAHLQGRLDEAIARYRQAIALQPDAPAKLGNLGVALDAQDRFAEAAHCLRQALALDPQNAETFFNLGNTLKSLGQTDEAIACYRHAIELRADFVEALDNLGVALQEQGVLEEAVACYCRALALHPNWPPTLANLGVALREQGKLDEAITTSLRAVQLGESAETRIAFAQAVCAASPQQLANVQAGLREWVTRAIAEAWGRPADLLSPSLALVTSNPVIGEMFDRATNSGRETRDAESLFAAEGLAAVADDALLIALLENTQANDATLERFLTMTRAALLVRAGNPVHADEALAFWCALARQCFINGYVFAETETETRRAKELRDEIAAMFSTGTPVPPLKLVAVAAYFPLHGIAGIASLLPQAWAPAINALLTQQVREPAREREIAAAMARATPITGEVSQRVRQQYEENPYPRWVKLPATGKPDLLTAMLKREFPLVPIGPAGATSPLEILVAGCGTGQHSNATARAYRHARVLAVDLSLASLGFAKRKSEELGVNNIDYAQADIMELGKVWLPSGRRFDLIESVGVLHHLDDPVAGWRVLLSLLKPRGLMRLGFYSERARRAVVAAREFIATHGYGSSAEEIRCCRQEILAQVHQDGAASSLAPLLRFSDFYGTSECRDLLFHVQETRYELPQLKSIIQELDLDFIGLLVEPAIRRQYDALYPGDPGRTNLDNWHVFEQRYLETFAGMYQFWVQARD